MDDLSHKTAIKRRGPSRPLKWLLGEGLIYVVHLDYGCGRGDDADYLDCDKYDPYYFPDMPSRAYSSITCTYVLNVIEDAAERTRVITKVASLLRPGGTAYFTVRRDLKKEGRTSTGTYQCIVKLDKLNLLYENSKFAIYELKRA